MRPEERHQYILNTIKKKGFVSILDAAAALDVSDETIRRDINILNEKNLLKKVRGGASAIKLPYRKEKEYLDETDTPTYVSSITRSVWSDIR